MRKALVMMCAGAVWGAWCTASAGSWGDDFDSYDTVTPLPDQSTWESWDGDPDAADFFATTAQSLSAPNACAIDDLDDAVHQYSGYTAGVWVYTAWQYIQTDMDDIQYFLLLNTYPASPSHDWSMQIECDAGAGLIRDFNGDEALPMVKGAWAQIRVVIDLDNDQQSVFYDGMHLVTKGWTDGVAEGGALNIAAVDLWANESAYEVYYDDLRLAQEMSLHGPPFPPPPGDRIDPIGPWHELWPVFCRMWECTDWIDNGDGELDYCDYLWLEIPEEEPGWWHVEDVTITVVLEWLEGIDLYLDWQGPMPPPDGDFDPVGPWHEIYPTYCMPWECVDWIDNGNGILDFCDWLVFDTPEGFFELHVIEVAIDIEVVRQEPPPPDKMWLDGPDFWPYDPVTDPVGPWHELWPDFCTPWDCTGWKDNGNGFLDYCDYLWLEMPDEEPGWWHVEDVTLTAWITVPGRSDFLDVYLDWVGEPPRGERFSPVGPWHEIYPDFCTPWECIDWVDTNGNGILDFCDWMVFELPDGTQFEAHVEAVATDIEVIPEEPPVEDEKWLDGPDFWPYDPVTDPIGPWHELWPVYCTPWDCTDWVDNGSGVLDVCDYILLENPFSTPEWWHVENVTITVTLEGGVDPPLYLDWVGTFVPDRFDPIGPWHEVYPEFCRPWDCIDWIDSNENGVVDFCDWLVLMGPDGLVEELHVVEVATDIELKKEEPPVDHKWLDGMQYWPYYPVTDPTGPWHELWPVFCTDWDCTDWIDNSDGVLSHCDYMKLENPFVAPSWWHVEMVTLTAILEDEPPAEPLFFDWMGDFAWEPFDPIGPWHEIFPVFCRVWDCIDWEDNGNGYVDHCDWLVFMSPEGEVVQLHVVEVATDIEVVAELPPCPPDINGDGVVDVLDLLAVLAAWGTTGDVPEDVNDDGVVDVLDLIMVLSWWGQCPG